MHWVWILMLLTSCAEERNVTRTVIDGRSGKSLYQFIVPDFLVMKQVEPSMDSKLPIAEMESKGVRATIHNFPGMKIPAEAQIQRWRGQFSKIEELDIVPQAWGGFSGYRMSCVGRQKGERVALLGWAMQIAPEHARSLHFVADGVEKSSPWTLKIVGSPAILKQKRKAFIQLAESFELCEEIPCDP